MSESELKSVCHIAIGPGGIEVSISSVEECDTLDNITKITEHLIDKYYMKG